MKSLGSYKPQNDQVWVAVFPISQYQSLTLTTLSMFLKSGTGGQSLEVAPLTDIVVHWISLS